MGRTPATPIAVGLKNAARMMDMKATEFSALVDSGALPRPTLIAGKHPRWSVASLQGVLNGDAISDEFEP